MTETLRDRISFYSDFVWNRRRGVDEMSVLENLPIQIQVVNVNYIDMCRRFILSDIQMSYI